jgi:uncharacterized membrane protein
MAKIETSIVVNRPLEEVFAFTTNLENQLKYQPRLLEAKKTSEGPIGVGTTWRLVGKVLGQRMEFEQQCTEYELNRKFAGRPRSGPFALEERRTYEQVEGGTRFNLTFDFQPRGFMKLAEPLLVSMLKRQAETDLMNLKKLMETNVL